MHFLEIICADIVFFLIEEVSIYTYILIWGEEPWPPKPDPKGSNAVMPPKRQKMAQRRHFPLYKKKTKKFGLHYLLGRKQAISNYSSEIGIPL